jgi:NAD(P)-dependent dehydrogenase (short-subunit alcohol dehydrogenase family)
MKKAGSGSIISVSSIEGYRGLPNLVPYATFKLGIEGFTKSLALELGPSGIRVNAIAPETTETEQLKPSEWIPPQHRRRVKDWIPLGRFGVPQDVAGCAVFLATELSAWVTGSTIHCDGGALAAAGWYRTPEGQWTNTPVIEGSGLSL